MTPPLSPERQRLSDTISRVAQIEAELARLREARARIGQPWHLDTAIADAETALAEARAHEPRRLVDEALGCAAGGQPTVAEAEAGLAGAKAEADRRRGAQALLDEEERRLHDALRFALGNRREAIGAVIRSDPAFAALFAEFDAALERAADLRSIFNVLGLAMTPRDLDHAALIERPGTGRGVAEWRVALAALETDAAAPLPDAVFGVVAEPAAAAA